MAARVLRKRKAPTEGAAVDTPPSAVAAAPAPGAASPAGTTRLGELLLRDNEVDPDELAQALADQAATGRKLGQLLLSRGLISDTALAKVLAEQLGLPLADLGQATLNPTTAALLSEDVARAAQAIPLGEDNGAVDVAL